MLAQTDAVSSLLAARNFTPHYEPSTADKKVRWDLRTGAWIAVHWRPLYATFRVEFADPARVLKHSAITEAGAQFEKNGGRSLVFDPLVPQQVADVVNMTNQWIRHYK